MKNSSTQTIPAQTQEVRSGNPEFDRSRFRAKGFNDKPEKSAAADPMAILGDIAEGISRILFSPDTAMILGYLGAGWCLYKSSLGWSILTGGALTGAIVAVIEQFLELLPRLPKYFPGLADQLAFKLGLTRFVDPQVRDNSPTLLSEAKEWARDADRKQQRLMEWVSAACYLFALFAASLAFQLITPSLTLNPQGLWSVFEAVAGFELCILFANWAKRNRLTARESRQYRELKRRERAAAHQSMLDQAK